MPELRLIRESFPEDPVLDTAVSRALLERVAAGELPATLRIARPGAMVAFGKQDAAGPGYPAAARAARERGFEAVVRLAGGRAAVFHEGTVAVAHAMPDPNPRPGVFPRFEAVAELIAAALRTLGADARVGEVEGEYCPGGYSVNARGSVKLAGVGQRLIKGAAHVGGVVVAAGADRIRDVLVPVYRELGLDWRPDTAGATADEVAGLDSDAVRDALLEQYAERYDLVEGRLDEGTLALARRLAPEHRSPGQAAVRTRR
ncbi:MAG: biotin/lipoate A/B protein ligase family protein [Thermoleophilaceae bacterium]